jgi:hypothetical protein
MKPLLMHADREFDQYGVFRDLMYRYRRPDEKPQLPVHQQTMMEDLALHTVLDAMAGKDEFLFEVAREAMLSGLQNGIGTIVYRQEVLKDCLKNPDVIHQLYRLAVEAIEQTRRQWWSLSSAFPSSLLYDAIGMLEVRWPPLSRLFWAGNKLMFDGSEFKFGAASASKPPVAIPALESALRSHPCGALSSVRVPPV